jgi:hypothetical protein
MYIFERCQRDFNVSYADDEHLYFTYFPISLYPLGVHNMKASKSAFLHTYRTGS